MRSNGRAPFSRLITVFVAMAMLLSGGRVLAQESPEKLLAQALGWVADEPDKAWARAALGDAYVAMGRHEDALAAYKTALRFEPGNVFAMNGMAYAFLGLGKPDRALPFLLDAVRTDPEKGDRKTLAYTYQVLKMDREALDIFDSIIGKDPGNIEILNSRGQLLSGMGENEKAAESFEAAIRIDPSRGDYVNLGYSYSALGMEEKAKSAFREGIAYRPKDTESLNALGFSLFSRGKIDEAREIFLESLKIDPSNIYVLNGLGYVYGAMKDTAKAVEYLEKGALVDPRQADFTTLGYAYGTLGRHEDAADAFRRAVANNPDSAAEAWHGLGYTLITLKRNVEAMDAFRRSYMLMPEPRTLNSLGYAYMVVRNYPQAIEAFNRALKIDPEDAQARFNLGLAMLDLDRRAEARKYYGELLKIDPAVAADLKKVMDEAWK